MILPGLVICLWNLKIERMEFLQKALYEYAENHTSPESELLKKIYRDTQAKILMPRMISGHLQGSFLTFISHLVRPKTILEIGTFTGYSALCLARGLQKGGKLFTLDRNEELEDRVRSYFSEAGMDHLIDYRIGLANQIIPTLEGPFDLVFIDADKAGYPHYFDLVIEKMSPNGVILADNVLWGGKVVQANPNQDTRAILAFNEKIQKDPRVENILLPLRDGIMLMRKVSL